MYIWEQKDWPKLIGDCKALSPLLAHVSRAQGRLLGRMESLGFALRTEAHLSTLTQDVVQSSDIEGEKLEPEQVRSSIARRLGVDIGGSIPADRNVEGVVEMMMDATGNYTAPLTEDRLFGWHAALFPTGRSGMFKITVGDWRDDANGPMQVVSGPVGKQQIHYEAPPAERLPTEVAAFLRWFESGKDIDPLLAAGLAHLWFVTLHPFDDGNGRIARAIADMALARSEGTGQRFYSMSAQIRTERNAYYDILKTTQNGPCDVTVWQTWFLNCLLRAIEGADSIMETVLAKARFWERFAKAPLNERQIKVLNRVMDGFEGTLTTSKWAKLGKCSQDTAYRDILDLIVRGALQKEPGGGRSTSYSVILHHAHPTTAI
ncbi:MAG: Fic family protein [Gammaproteobacteria bacterium]|nr:Fic family protein [Gammaproteobacteria bacterium]